MYDDKSNTFICNNNKKKNKNSLLCTLFNRSNTHGTVAKQVILYFSLIALGFESELRLHYINGI